MHATSDVRLLIIGNHASEWLLLDEEIHQTVTSPFPQCELNNITSVLKLTFMPVPLFIIISQ